MHTTIIPTLAIAMVGLVGCKSKSYTLVGAPFCASDEPGVPLQFSRPLTLLTKGSNEYSATGLSTMLAGPAALGHVSTPDLLAAVIECDERPQQYPQDWREQLTDDQVPSLCGNQRVVFHGRLQLEESERAKAVGLGGFLRIPPLDVACTAGQLSQDDHRTLAQILSQFHQSVQAYDAKHERLPTTLAQLRTDTLQPELPPDPWGNPVRFSTEGGTVFLHSSGPDSTPNTDDDVEMIESAPGSMRAITSFDVDGLTATADYRAFVSKSPTGE